MPEGQALPPLQAFRKGLARRITQPIIAALAKTPLTPNALTVLSLVVTAGAAVLVAMHYLVWGGVVVLFASVFDIFDGALARATNRVTKFGAALDSTFDRLAEGLILVGLMVVFADKGSTVGVTLAGLALITSFLVSYTRARAEGLGLDCQVGIFTRSERIILLVAGLLFSRFFIVLPLVLIVIIVLSAVTAGQRLFLVWRKTRS